MSAPPVKRKCVVLSMNNDLKALCELDAGSSLTAHKDRVSKSTISDIKKLPSSLYKE